MTSRPTILIAPHRPALGSTTRSPHLVTCCLDDLPAASTSHPSGQSCWWGEESLPSAVTGMSAKTTEHLHCPQRVLNPCDQLLGSRKMDVFTFSSQVGKLRHRDEAWMTGQHPVHQSEESSQEPSIPLGA